MKCLMCSKEIENIPGKREKQFCGSSCRSKYWYSQNVKNKSKGPVVKDLTQPTHSVSPEKQPKANFTINTAPKNLDELKALCPPELTGLERSAWISKNRVKYGV